MRTINKELAVACDQTLALTASCPTPNPSLPFSFVLAVKVHREEGFHIDLEDFLMGLLSMANELVRSHLCHKQFNCNILLFASVS